MNCKGIKCHAEAINTLIFYNITYIRLCIQFQFTLPSTQYINTRMSMKLGSDHNIQFISQVSHHWSQNSISTKHHHKINQ